MEKEKRKLQIDVVESISLLHSLVKGFQLKFKFYNLLFRGKGLEFDGYTVYQPENDASLIDWGASMRANRTMMRKYAEERNQSILIVVDVGENMVLGSGEKMKCEQAAEAALLFTHLILTSGDRVGLLLFRHETVRYVPPRKGMNQYFLFQDLLSDASLYGGASSLDVAFQFLLGEVNKSFDGIVFISDFLRFSRKHLSPLRSIATRCDATAIVVKDPIDLELPDVKGEFVLEDYESGEQILIDPKIARETYREFTLRQEQFLKENFVAMHVDLFEILTTRPFALSLATFLKERLRKEVSF